MFTHITPSILNIGVADADLDMFENQFPLTDGVTYNSYVITDGGVTAVIDSVDRRRTDDWLQRIDAAAPGGVDYIVVQHMEPDHSSSLHEFIKRHPLTRIVTSAQAQKMMHQFFPTVDFGDRFVTVGDGSELKVGSHTLVFTAAPMVHWPEVLLTFDRTDGVLFSADAFGTFGCSDDFDGLWPDEARRYYSNIVGKYGMQVRKLLTRAAALEGLSHICPLHGPVIPAERIAECVRLYGLWSSYTPELPEGVLIAYASIYGHTARVAQMMGAILEERGVTVSTVDLCRKDVSVAVSETFRMGRVVLASPTYDAGMFPAMHDFLYHLQIKGVTRRRFGLIENGSWAPSAARAMGAMTAALKDCETVGTTVTVRSAPDESTPAALAALADELLK